MAKHRENKEVIRGLGNEPKDRERQRHYRCPLCFFDRVSRFTFHCVEFIMNLASYIAIIIILLLSLIVAFICVFYDMIKPKTRYLYFLFRWALIGKYHCNNPKNQKIGFILNKAVWLVIALCFCYTLTNFLGL